MQIPNHGFGFKGAEVRHTNIGNAGAGAGRGLQQLGATATQVGAEMADDEIRKAQAAREVKAARAVGERELAIDTLAAGIKIQMDEGKLSHDKAEAAYQEGLSKLTPPDVDGIDPDTKGRMDFQIDMLGKRGGLQLQPHIAAARQGEMRSDIDAVLDSQSKQAAFVGADVNAINARVEAMDEHGRVAYGEKWGAVKQNFIDRNWSSNITAQVAEAGDDLGKLRALKAELGSDKYADKLDANNRLNLTAHLDGSISRIEQHNEMLAMKREIRAQGALQDIERQNASGIPPTPEMMQEWESVAAGTSSAPHVTAMIQQGREIQGFLRAPIDQQQATIQAMETNLKQNGGDAQAQASVATMRKVFDANKESLTKTPLVYAQERLGAQVEPVDMTQLMLPGNEGNLFSALRDRSEIVQTLQQKHGSEVQNILLLPQEADMLKAQITKMPPDQQRQFFGGLNKASGGGKEYKAIMQQIAPDEPVTAFAGMLASKQESTVIERNFFSPDTKTASKDVSALMLQGNAIIKDKDAKFPLPKDADFAAQFDQFAGGAFANAPKAYQTGMQSVKAYYAGRAAQDGDVSGMVDPKLMRESINAVLGAPVEHNGKTVLAPWGMDEDTFTSKAEASYQSLGLSVDFDNVNLVPAGDGRYGITSGRAPILKNGKPVYIEVR